MNWLDFIPDRFLPKEKKVVRDPWTFQERNIPEASHGYKPLFTISYDGEKNRGEVGPIKIYRLDHIRLRARAWQSYLDSEITQGILNKFVTWIIGSGLKLQSEPMERVLQDSGISIDKETFSTNIEDRFKLFSKSKCSSITNLNNLNKNARKAYLNAIIGGDVLVVLRLIKREIKIEIIDATHVRTPFMDSNLIAAAKAKGNKIVHGIEIDKNGEHVAYYVTKSLTDSQRIKAKSNGRLTAFLVYGLEYRIDNVRGMPLISAVLESIKKIDRYKEAVVGSAEERQKIPFAIEHGTNSNGENVFISSMQKSFNADSHVDNQTGDIDGEVVAAKIAATTQKTVVNMPIDSTLKALESKNELNFKDFYSPNVNSICSAIGIPPEVALSKYDSNFSASRAALKDWEHTINVERISFADQFYQPIYNFWLQIEVLKGNITASGYIEAVAQGNTAIVESYQMARFVGANVPHIDPLKEVAAERLKLGDAGAHIPLTTGESATENVNGGDFDSNLEQFKNEISNSEELKPVAPSIPENDNE